MGWQKWGGRSKTDLRQGYPISTWPRARCCSDCTNGGHTSTSLGHWGWTPHPAVLHAWTSLPNALLHPDPVQVAPTSALSLTVQTLSIGNPPESWVSPYCGATHPQGTEWDCPRTIPCLSTSECLLLYLDSAVAVRDLCCPTLRVMKEITGPSFSGKGSLENHSPRNHSFHRQWEQRQITTKNIT